MADIRAEGMQIVIAIGDRRSDQIGGLASADAKGMTHAP